MEKCIELQCCIVHLKHTAIFSKSVQARGLISFVIMILNFKGT